MIEIIYVHILYNTKYTISVSCMLHLIIVVAVLTGAYPMIPSRTHTAGTAVHDITNTTNKDTYSCKLLLCTKYFEVKNTAI